MACLPSSSPSSLPFFYRPNPFLALMVFLKAMLHVIFSTPHYGHEWENYKPLGPFGSEATGLLCQCNNVKLCNNLQGRGDCQNTRKSRKTSCSVGCIVG